MNRNFVFLFDNLFFFSRLILIPDSELAKAASSVHTPNARCVAKAFEMLVNLWFEGKQRDKNGNNCA